MSSECENVSDDKNMTTNLDEQDQEEQCRQQLQADDREADRLLQAFHERSDTLRCATWLMLGTAYISQICFVSKKYPMTWKHLALLWGSGFAVLFVLGPLWHRWHGWRRSSVYDALSDVTRIGWARTTRSGTAISTSSFL